MQKQGKSLNTKRAQNYEDDENDFEEFNQRPQKKIKNENKEIKKKFDSMKLISFVLKDYRKRRF